jgi:hypothetical protein
MLVPFQGPCKYTFISIVGKLTDRVAELLVAAGVQVPEIVHLYVYPFIPEDTPERVSVDVVAPE